MYSQGEALASADLSVDPEAFTTGLFGGLATALRRVAGHDVAALGLLATASAALQREGLAAQGAKTAAAAATAPPPVRVVMTALVDVAGFRVSAMAIPPVEEDATLVYGKLDAAAPFVQRSADLAAVLRRLGKSLNLKPHAVEVLAETPGAARGSGAPSSRRTLVVPLSVELQGHACADGRTYVMNAGRLLPAELPAAPSQRLPAAIASTLRPELVAASEHALSSDAYRSDPAVAQYGVWPGAAAGVSIGTPPDAHANDVDAARASQHLLTVVIPAFAAALDALDVLPTDSFELTRALHAAGINVRHLGRIAGHAGQPHVVALCEAEMVARVAKHILAKNMRRIVRQAAAAAVASYGGSRAATWQASHAALVQAELMACAVDLFNLLLGAPGDDESVAFWEGVVVPAVAAKFLYRLRTSGSGGVTASLAPFKAALLCALQHHCGIALARDEPPLPLTVAVLAASSAEVRPLPRECMCARPAPLAAPAALLAADRIAVHGGRRRRHCSPGAVTRARVPRCLLLRRRPSPPLPHRPPLLRRAPRSRRPPPHRTRPPLSTPPATRSPSFRPSRPCSSFRLAPLPSLARLQGPPRPSLRPTPSTRARRAGTASTPPRRRRSRSSTSSLCGPRRGAASPMASPPLPVARLPLPQRLRSSRSPATRCSPSAMPMARSQR